MSISGRRESKTGFYHVFVRGINNERIFNQHREKIYFKSIILKQLSDYQIEIYSYCIMSNHAHFIIRAEITVLSAFMAKILKAYAQYYNWKHNRNGHVFQNRFKSECIEDENYFWSCLRYIHMNPVKAKMIKKVEQYKYSSISEYISGNPMLISKNALKGIGDRFREKTEFLEYHHKKPNYIFNDVKVEIMMQQEEMALSIAETLQKEYKLPLLCQVIEEKDMREVFMKRIQEELNISRRRSKELCLITKNKIDK